MRLKFRDALPLDLVPFGEIADEKHRIKWPPKGEPEMSVIGFEEVFKFAEPLMLSNAVHSRVPLASPAGLCLLKIVSWADNRLMRTKDIQDLAFIVRHYIDMGNWERLESEDSEVTEMENFTVLKASARLLGRDIAAIASAHARRRVVEILSAELSRYSTSKFVLILDDSLDGLEPDESLKIVQNLMKGIEE